MNQSHIRNFAIVAHIDHGKSTLADRLMELTGTVSSRDSQEQLLDSHPVSRERGITIRLAPVTMKYQEYQLNLIDTPGHVDFSYEVERSLAACEGAILLVDATQGVQAQTLAHLDNAKKLGINLIPVINKIDSPNANVPKTEQELKSLVNHPISFISARTGEGVAELLDRIVKEIPSPSGNEDAPLRALVFSSQFDQKRGVIAFLRLIDGQIKDNDQPYFLASKKSSAILELGQFTPKMVPIKELTTGQVGYVVTNLKDAGVVTVGDTMTLTATPEVSALAGYQQPQPMVFVSFFPIDQDEYNTLEDALKKLKLNDAAIVFSPTSSRMLGRGFRCGFLGHLHAEVAQERLEEDFDLGIIATTPVVELQQNGASYSEPWVKAQIFVPKDFIGPILTLCEERRGVLLDMTYHENIATLTYDLPLSEIITDFFDLLKSHSSGFASINYELVGYREFDPANLEILINHEPVDALSMIVPKQKAATLGKFFVAKLKEAIPRQQIPIPIQAVVDGQIIAREDVAAFRKDVIAKLYGGDVTRKKKLLEKQKKGKEKMKSIGKVSIPGDTFLKIFRT